MGQVSKGGTAYLMNFCYRMKCLCGYGLEVSNSSQLSLIWLGLLLFDNVREVHKE